MSHQIIKAGSEHAHCKVGIAVARWNSFITEKLLEGALDALSNKGIKEENVVVAYCPGAYEIPFTARKLLSHTDGVMALGAVIRGDTPHFHYVCDAVNRGITNLNMQGNKPAVFGVLTTDNVQQARERAGLSGDKGNKGAEAALALLEMVSLTRKLDQL
ncbi:MAG TPA: 6,7-dimethyl-8-ribityllumazine synthase [Fodinibius sp.]|nr:6,7-dimethyl-8-ribityllumazine synthase [Fodinibius sp.]